MAPFVSTCARLLALLFLGVSPSSWPRFAAGYRRQRGKESKTESLKDLLNKTQETYQVELLVTRHGLSCTNIVEKYVSWYDAGRGNIHDPLLGGAAEHACAKTGADIEAWLQKHGETVDATLSSVLARAMETALRSYPKYAKPLYVVPHIRETANGPSNAPKEHGPQVDDLSKALGGTSFAIDYRWVNAFGSDGVNWDDFKHFLATSFLPDLLERSGKPPGSKIVLAVVTHSNFMRDSEVGKMCAHFWKNRGESKALNNQVLKMSYTYKIATPASDSIDVTPTYDLHENTIPCEEVSGGQSANDPQTGKSRQTLCLKDIGKCAKSIQAHAWLPGKLWAKTYEKQIMDLQAKLAKDTKSRESARDELDKLQSAMALRDFPHEEDQDWRLDQLQWNFRQLEMAISEAQATISKLSRATCWSGGHPQDLPREAVPW